MTTFSEELRRAREAKNISLADISKSTRINMKYLEALDQGTFDILPQAYIRAFIREYALSVGLSPSEMLQKYDILVTGRYAAGQTPTQASGMNTAAVPVLREPPRDAGPVPTEELLVKQRSMRTIVIIASIVALCILVLVYVATYIWESKPGPATRETPFSEVVREKEAERAMPVKADTAAARAADTLAVTPGGGTPLPAAPSDSITLSIRATAVVWMSIVRDSGYVTEFLLEAGQKKTVRAKSRFVLTTGNAGGAVIAVNRKDLGVLGGNGIVLRNLVITSDGVKQ